MMSIFRNKPIVGVRASRPAELVRRWASLIACASAVAACSSDEGGEENARGLIDLATASATIRSLRIVRFPPGASMQTVAALELWSEVKPWHDTATGNESWVLAADDGLVARLRGDGLIVEPLTLPPEFSGWSPPQQQAFNLVAKQCQSAPGAVPVPTSAARAASVLPGLDARYSPIGTAIRYSSYYLPYYGDGQAGVPAFQARLGDWAKNAAERGYSTFSGGAKVPRELLGGWPLDSTARQIKDANGQPMAYIDIGWKSAGMFNGSSHAGPASLVVLVANQHPRELVTFEAAWRLAQRIVASYAIGVDDGEWGRGSYFWRGLIDAGVHVLIVPSANPSQFHRMTTVIWPNDPLNTGGAGSGTWIRANPHGVDLNRNWPGSWLQPRPDADERWGTGAATNAGFAGTSPGSEPEVQGIMAVIDDALNRIDEVGAPTARLPAVALDIHASYGTVLIDSHMSTATSPRSDASDEAWLCGVASDCINPDMPALSAVFGNNNRPSVVGATGLETSLGGPNADDPALPYTVGRQTLNIYATSGDIAHALSAKRWKTASNPTPRAIMAATTEVTAFKGPNVFGFGTCAPPAQASEAIDQVVRDLMPLVARMAESSFDPATVGVQATPKRPRVEFPRARDLANLGVVAEARAQAKTWAVEDCTSSEAKTCFPGTCDPSKGQVCSGTWWSSYLPGTRVLREPLAYYWGIAVRHPDPRALVPKEADADAVRLRLLSCEPAERCVYAPAECDDPRLCFSTPKSLTVIRRGSLYDLWGIQLAGPADRPPSKIRVRRDVRRGAAWTPTDEWTLVSGEVPNNAAWSTFPDAGAAASRLELADLALLDGPNASLYDVRIDAPLLNARRSTMKIGVRWPGAPVPTFPLVAGAIDYTSMAFAAADTAKARWADPNTFVTPLQWYTYDYDLQGLAGTDLATYGRGVFVARMDGGLTDAERFPPIVTAVTLSGPLARPQCPLTAIGTSAASLTASRALRDQVLANGPWGIRYVRAYEEFGDEVVSLATAHPELAAAISRVARSALRATLLRALGKTAIDELARDAASANQVLAPYASPDLRRAAGLAIKHLPDLAREVAASPWSASLSATIQGGL